MKKSKKYRNYLERCKKNKKSKLYIIWKNIVNNYLLPDIKKENISLDDILKKVTRKPNIIIKG